MKDFCAATTPTPKLRLHIQYRIDNTGVSAFTPPAGFVGKALCGEDEKDAVLGFLQLLGAEPILATGQAAPKYAACVVDDALATTYEDACSYAKNFGMIINTGASYGTAYDVTVKYSIDPTQISSFLSSSNGKIKLSLLVNQSLSPNGNWELVEVDINLLTPMVDNQ